MTARYLLLVVLLVGTGSVRAQQLDTTPSRKVLDASTQDDCEAVSSVVQRCAQKSVDPNERKDELTKSREKTKAAFDREDRQGTADALRGKAPGVNTPVGDAERLGGVTVTGRTESKLSVEEVLQRAIGPPVGVSNGNGTVSRYGPNGSRFDCVEKCVGPACCVEVRALPNPAREVSNIGR